MTVQKSTRPRLARKHRLNPIVWPIISIVTNYLFDNLGYPSSCIMSQLFSAGLHTLSSCNGIGIFWGAHGREAGGIPSIGCAVERRSRLKKTTAANYTHKIWTQLFNVQFMGFFKLYFATQTLNLYVLFGHTVPILQVNTKKHSGHAVSPSTGFGTLLNLQLPLEPS